MKGVDEISPMISRGLAELFAATSHHVSNIVIRFDGPDAATSICYLYAMQRYLGSDAVSELWGQYHHSFCRAGTGWQISRLVLRAVGMKDFHRENMHPSGRRNFSLQPK